MRDPRIVLSGYYGFGNLGDEALLAVIIAQLRARFAGCTIDVLSATPDETARTYGVEATPRMDLGAVRRAIEKADIVLSGGGGLLQNVTSLKSLLYYAGVIRTAIRAKKATMIFAQSIGPLDFWGKSVVREFCRGVSLATADPVFLFEPGAAPLDLAAEGLGPSDAPLVVVSVRRWSGGDATASAIANAVDHLGERYGARVAFLPLGGAADAEASTVVIRRCRTSPVLLPDYPLAQAAQVIGQAQLVIGMRLHALVIAARLGVPFLAVPYDPKIDGLCDDLAYPLPPLWVPAAKVTPDPTTIERAVDHAWSQRASVAEHLRAKMPAITALAERNFAALDELVKKSR